METVYTYVFAQFSELSFSVVFQTKLERYTHKK